MAFEAPSIAHHLSNPFEQDLCSLMGGKAKHVEIADFPELGKCVLRNGEAIEIYERNKVQRFT